MRNKRVLFIQHSEVDRPGLLGETLAEIGLPLDVIRPDLGQPVPEALDGFAGLVLGGGPQGAYEQEKYPYLSSECALVRHAARVGKPVLGLCLGAQLMASLWEHECNPVSPKWVFLRSRWIPSRATIRFGEECLRSLSPHIGTAMSLIFLPAACAWVLRPHPESTFPLWPRTLWAAIPSGNDPRLFGEAVTRAYGLLVQSGIDADLIWQQGQQFLPLLHETASTVFTRWSEMLC